MSAKSLPPTPRRLARAHREGQVARSRLATGVAAVSGAAVMLGSHAPEAWQELEGLLIRTLSASTTIAPHAATEALRESTGVLLAWSLPVVLCAALSGLVANVLIGGLHATPEVLFPRASRIAPSAALRRIFSPRQWIEPLGALALALALGGLAWARREELMSGWHRAVRLDGATALREALARTWGLGTTWLAWLVLGGVLAGLWARHRHLAELSMSHEEVRREHQQAEGDPQHKAQRRAQHRQLVAQGSARGVAAATAVVVNPTHLAVALRYAPQEHEAPYLVAKGRDQTALELREEARRLGIPVLKDIPLARSLIPLDVGEAIPEELYRAAAALLLLAEEERNAGLRSTP